MNPDWRWLGSLVLVLLFTSVALPAQSADALPAGDGHDLVAQVCSQCHSVDLVTKLRDGPEAWKRRVDQMVLRGAQLLPDEEAVVVSYLSKNFGPGVPMRSGTGIPPPLAEGSQKLFIASHCLLCHDAGRIAGATRTRQGWSTITKDMLSRMPAGFATNAEVDQIVEYLVAHYGDKGR